MSEAEMYKDLQPRYMKPLRAQNTKEKSAYMKERKQQNITASRNNANELWMLAKLQATGYKWTRQATWGYRIFDFWCAELGIAVECDGPEHDADYDGHRDEYNLRRSAIRVLRVRNRNEDDATKVLLAIAEAVGWAERRHILGIDGKTKREKRRLVMAAGK